jgi:hypothetical protein
VEAEIVSVFISFCDMLKAAGSVRIHAQVKTRGGPEHLGGRSYQWHGPLDTSRKEEGKRTGIFSISHYPFCS